jgi:hypothetical protein
LDINSLNLLAINVRKLIALDNHGDDSFGSTFVVVFGNKLFLMSVPGFNSQEEKYQFKVITSSLLKAFSADACLHLTEAWTLPQSVVDGLSQSQLDDVLCHGISNHPGRQEILNIYIENKDMKAMSQGVIVRDSDGGLLDFTDHKITVEIKKSEEADGSAKASMTGIFVDFFNESEILNIPDDFLLKMKNHFQKDIMTIIELEEKLKFKIN